MELSSIGVALVDNYLGVPPGVIGILGLPSISGKPSGLIGIPGTITPSSE